MASITFTRSVNQTAGIRRHIPTRQRSLAIRGHRTLTYHAILSQYSAGQVGYRTEYPWAPSVDATVIFRLDEMMLAILRSASR